MMFSFQISRKALPGKQKDLLGTVNSWGNERNEGSFYNTKIEKLYTKLGGTGTAQFEKHNAEGVR